MTKQAAVSEIDPFAPGALDQETELAALAHALEFASGFSLLFVVCNQAPQRRQLMAEVRGRLPEFTIQEIIFNEPVNHLLDELRDRLAEPLPNAIFVSGLEHSMPHIADAAITSFIANLNASRNSIPSTLPRPLVFWIPEYVLTAIAHGAPDFFSIRSGVYSFAVVSDESMGFAQTLSAGKNWQAISLPLAEKRDRVAAIEQLLAEYKAMPSDRRDRRMELRLIDRLGILLRAWGDYSEALSQIQRGHKLAEEIGDREGIALFLHHLGVLYLDRGEYEQALEHYEKARRIFEELGDLAGVANSLGQIGVLHKNRGEYEQARQHYELALRIFERLDNRMGIAISMHNIGILHQVRGEYDQARRYYEKAMQIAEELGDRAGVAGSLHMIGRLHQAQGEYGDALLCYQQSLRIKEELGDISGLATSQSQLGKLYIETGQYEAALPLLLSALNTFRRLQSPFANIVESHLKSLRTQWGHRAFDAAWWEARGEDLPEWLRESSKTAS